MITPETRLASLLLLKSGESRIFVSDLDKPARLLFDKVLQSDGGKAESWACEGVVNLYCSRGSVQALSHSFP